MHSQEILTDRLAHLHNKKQIKLRELQDQSDPELSRIRKGVLDRVIKAIKKIADQPESYGLCEHCGKVIPLSRLKSVPEAEFHIECEKKRGGNHAR